MPSTAYSTYVPAEGNENADIVIIGESPGQTEVAQRRPFVGKTGQKLDEFLGMVGLKREDVWLTNAVKYQPKGDKEKYFFSNGKPSDIFVAGIAELQEELLRIQPNIAVPMGNYALWALTGKTGIMRYRGSILESVLVPGLKVVPTLHPSYILRQWAEHPLLVWDLQRVATEARSPLIELPSRRYVIFPSGSEIAEATACLVGSETITIDTEWFSPDDLSCIGFTSDPSWAICIPTYSPGAIEAFRAILSSDARKIFQNAMFDVANLERVGLPVKTLDDEGNRLVEDTMIAHALTWTSIKKGLETTCSIYTREPYYKDERKLALDEERTNLEQYYTYNCKDVCVTHEIWLALQDEMDEFKTRAAYELNMRMFAPLKRASRTGVRCDYGELKRAITRYDEEAEEMQRELDHLFGFKLNVRSHPQVKAVVYDFLGAPKRMEKPTAQETLMDIAASTSNQVLKVMLTKIIKLREKRNVRSKYVRENLLSPDGRIRSLWNIAGAAKTGRLSASKDKWKNCGASLQTFPEEARELCIADEGYIFLKPDQAQAEARIVAYLADDYKTIDWIEAGLDIHCKMVETIYKIPYDDIRAAYKAGDKDAYRQRFICKTCKHGTNYMMGKILLRQVVNRSYHETGIGITTKEADTVRSIILAQHPLEVWWKNVESQLRNKRYLENPLGRRRIFTEHWATALKEGVAFVPQSTAHDLNMIGLDRVESYLRKQWPDDDKAVILADLHDGALIQLPEAEHLVHAKAITDLMSIPVQINGHDITIPIEVAVGKRWSDAEEVAL